MILRCLLAPDLARALPVMVASERMGGNMGWRSLAPATCLTDCNPLEAHLSRAGGQQGMEAQSHGVCKTRIRRSCHHPRFSAGAEYERI